MALTQSAMFPGPSWDEEVVPALRKRLESESRTLARRLSAISISSGDEALRNQNYQPDTTLSEKEKNVDSSVSFQQLGVQQLHTVIQHQRHYSDRKIPKTTTPRVNGSESSSKPKFERMRTYSSPYASAIPNGQGPPNGNARAKTNANKSNDPPRSSTSRPPDVKPTRIPKAARGGSFSYSPHMNGYGHNPSAVTPPSQPQSPEITSQVFSEQRGPQRTASSTRSIVEPPGRVSRQGVTLLNESPPFTSVSTMSSILQHDDKHQNEDPPRPSMESEERPYEHWYRGEVSRNGGVGELRVGRRQEMLDIANYGHTIGKKKKPATNRVPPTALVDEPRRHRKRADSIGGMTDKERGERGSLYLDDEHASRVGRVLDESPLTDLDGEDSDINSVTDYHDGPYAYIPQVEDNPASRTPMPGTYEAFTPTPVPSSMIPRPSSRQQQSTLPTRIPAPSSSRRSSESRRSAAASPVPAPMTRGASEPPQLPSSSNTPSPPPTSSSSHSRQQPFTSNTLPSAPGQKRAVSPASKKSRTAASKATRAKTTASRKEQDEQLNRKSVAYYPTPAGQGDDDMADAIPSWTQPVHREGNWDEVVLPVVARKRGLDGHYESADGGPKPKKVDNTVAPAPGTFRYDHSKYRPPRNDSEIIPMDEFGRPSDQDGNEQQQRPYNEVLPTMNEEPHGLKSKQPPSTSPALMPRHPPDVQAVAPFAGMVPQQQQLLEKEGEDEVSGGCCKCIIM